MSTMTTGDRLTVIGMGVALIIAITNGTCLTNQRFNDMNQRLTDMQRAMETGFSEATQQRDQIIRRIERLEDLHLERADAE